MMWDEYDVSRFDGAVSADLSEWEVYVAREVERSSVRGGRGAEPPDELWRWTGVELARAIRTRDVSSREATESCLARIEEVNPKLNALVEVSPEEALEMADASDWAVGAGEELGPLHGVPLTDWTRAYHGTNLERLVDIKERYDPDNFFHFHQSIPNRVHAGDASATGPSATE